LPRRAPIAADRCHENIGIENDSHIRNYAIACDIAREAVSLPYKTSFWGVVEPVRVALGL
jgi:hypothetical protein